MAVSGAPPGGRCAWGRRCAPRGSPLYNAGAMTLDSPAAHAARLHAEALVFDGHADTLLDILDRGLSFAAMTPEHHIDLPRLAAGGLNAEFFTAFVEPTFIPGARARATALIDTLHAQAARFPDRLAVALTADQVEEAVRSGRCAAIPAIEGGHAIEDSLENLAAFHARGVRLMTLTWNNSNGWADGCLPDAGDPRHGGLNDLGRRVIGEMERLGVIVDISHAAPETFWHVEAIATKPFVASHSCAAALNPHFRNLTDEQLRAVARHGGVVGVCFASPFLVDELGAWEIVQAGPEYARIPPDQRSNHPSIFHMTDAEAALYFRTVPLATLDDLLDHIDHMVRVMGVAHVGLGTDFDGVRRLPVGLEDAAHLPALTAGLVARGYADADIRAILGGNWLRVMRAVCG